MLGTTEKRQTHPASVKTIKANAARIELEREFYPAQSSSNQCPPGTNMVTVDERWKVLFIRGGKKKGDRLHDTATAC